MREWLPPLLIIPALALLAPVVEAPLVDGYYQLPAHGVTHLEGTAWIDDDWARIGLSAHGDQEFSTLGRLRAGNVIIVVDLPLVEVYQIQWLWAVEDADIADYLTPTNQESITLITCISDTGRLVAYGERIR